MKQPIILGGLLALSLAGAYLSWTSPEDPNSKDSGVTILRNTEDALRSITWTDEDKKITMTRPSDGAGDYFHFDHTDYKKIPKPAPVPEPSEEDPAAEDPAAEDGAQEPGEEGDAAAEAPEEDPPEPEYDIEEEQVIFTGGATAEEVWSAFAPLTGLRELSMVDDGSLEAYGLDEPTASIKVTTASGDSTLELGGESFGTKDRYARVNGKIYLIDDKTIRPLQFAKSRLVERRLHPFETKDIRQAEIRRNADQRAFVQGNADDQAKAFWADAAEPEEDDIEATTWMSKLLRMRVRAYPPAADVPELTPVFSFQLKGPENASWKVDVLKGQVEGKDNYYAKSQFNRLPVELTKSLADEAIAELDSLFDGKPAEEATPTEEATPATPVVPG